jgi:hypothetical protein
MDAERIYESKLARMMRHVRMVIRHWYGQAAVAALAALLCFVSMYSIYLHLSKRLPDGSKIYQKTGLYIKKNWARGESTASLGSGAPFCLVSAFSRGYCGFEGSGNIVTVSLTTFPRLWGDVDVVLDARTENKVLSDDGLEKKNLFVEG